MASSVSSVSQREQTRYHSEMQRIRRPFMTIANPDPDTDSDEGNNNARPPPSHYQQSNYQYFPTNSFPHVPPPPPLPDHSPSTSGPAITPLSSNGSFHMAHASTGSAGTAASASGSSARSSPAPDTTPPPSTPGQALPAAPRLFTDVNIDASDTQGSPDGINAISRTSRDTPRSITTRAAMTLEPKLGIGFSPRSTDGHRPNTSPIQPLTLSGSSPTANTESSPSKRNILVSRDGDSFQVVDITVASSGIVIKELIFSKLLVTDDEQYRHSIYMTEIGQEAIGSPLSEDALFDICLKNKDAKFLVKENSALPPPPNYAPPPVPKWQVNKYPSRSNNHPPPHSPHSNHGSISSVSDRPVDLLSAGGYDGSSEADDALAERQSARSPTHFQNYPGSSATLHPNRPHPTVPTSSSPVKTPRSHRQAPSPEFSSDRTRRPSSPQMTRMNRPTSPIKTTSPSENSTLPSLGVPPLTINRRGSSNPLATSPPSRGYDDPSHPLNPNARLHGRRPSDTEMDRRAVSERETPMSGRMRERRRDREEMDSQGTIQPRRRYVADDQERARQEAARVRPNLISIETPVSQVSRSSRSTRPSTAGASVGSPTASQSNPNLAGIRPRTSHAQQHPSSLVPAGTSRPGAPVQTPYQSSRWTPGPLPPGAGDPKMRSLADHRQVPAGWLNTHTPADNNNKPPSSEAPAGPPSALSPQTFNSGPNKWKSVGDLRSHFRDDPASKPLPPVNSPENERPSGSGPLGRPFPGYVPSPPSESTLSRRRPELSRSHNDSRLAHSAAPYPHGRAPEAAPLVSPQNEPGIPVLNGSNNHGYPQQQAHSPGSGGLGNWRWDEEVRSGIPITSPHGISRSARDTRHRHDESEGMQHRSGSSALNNQSVLRPDYLGPPSRSGLVGPRVRQPSDETRSNSDTRLPIGVTPSNAQRPPLHDVPAPISPHGLEPPNVDDPRNSDGDAWTSATSSSGQTIRPRTPTNSRSFPIHEDDSFSKTHAYLAEYYKQHDNHDPESTIMFPPVPREPPPLPPTTPIVVEPTLQQSPVDTENDDDYEYDDDDDEELEDSGALWSKPMNAKRRSTISKARGPPLTLQTSNIPNGNSGNGTPTPPASRGPRTKGSDQDTAAWVTRPQPEIVYDRLEKFFPDHDLDKPVIDAPSGGSSPTAYDNAATLGENDRAHLKAKHKKSIRVVASQRKKALVRQSQMETPSATALRRRSTKMWGSKVEEVIASHGSDGLPTSVPESPSPSVPAVPPSPSKQVFKWVKGELIGKGTYGRVYLAMNATTGEVVAVKQVELPKTLSDREDSRQQSVVEALKAESETLKDLDHVNIVQYLGIEETADHLSIFLEYVPGGSVASCLRKLGKFRPDVVKSFTAQILAGLEYLHGRGILHRDLKADNILIDPHGICRISDFGISKRSSEIYENDAYTQMMGSVFWMAPEVVDSRKEGYSAKVDIWSLGCLWLEMLAGHRPWNQDDFLAVVYKLGERQEAPPVPEGVELTLQGENFRSKCFAVNPKERPTATELRYHEYLELPDNWVFTGLP